MIVSKARQWASPEREPLDLTRISVDVISILMNPSRFANLFETAQWPQENDGAIDYDALKQNKQLWNDFWDWVKSQCFQKAEELWRENGPFTTQDLLSSIVSWHRTSFLGVFGKVLKRVLEENPESGWEIRNYGPSAVIMFKVTWK